MDDRDEKTPKFFISLFEGNDLSEEKLFLSFLFFFYSRSTKKNFLVPLVPKPVSPRFSFEKSMTRMGRETLGRLQT